MCSLEYTEYLSFLCYPRDATYYTIVAPTKGNKERKAKKKKKKVASSEKLEVMKFFYNHGECPEDMVSVCVDNINNSHHLQMLKTQQTTHSYRKLSLLFPSLVLSLSHTHTITNTPPAISYGMIYRRYIRRCSHSICYSEACKNLHFR